jgi:uncharacterized membrane protein
VTALAFLLSISIVFGAILAMESEASARHPEAKNFGLISWLTTGNWPAKVGAGLLIVGIGALIRYAMINIEIAPAWKLGVGLAASGVLGLGATLTRIGTPRRAVSLALGGAAFGVAYLTAYSAFALFGYLDGRTGLSVLLLTSIGAGVYALLRNALSLSMLSMLGAFLAPAFAIGDPGPTVVYGYYVAASLLTLVTVYLRGWRPLIHLSFLFTLAGGAFFAWTAHYYSADHTGIMLPAVFCLVAIHLAMPIVERRGTDLRWVQTLDTLYMIALPTVAVLSAVVLSPSRSILSNTMLALAALWLAAGAFLAFARRDGSVAHVIIGLLMAGIAVAVRYQNIPWELLALGFTVGALWWSERRVGAERLQSVLAGLVPILGFVHVISALAPADTDTPFLNGRFVERLIGAALLIVAGQICGRLRHSLSGLLLGVGIGWGLLAFGFELLRADLLTAALLAYWIAVIGSIAIGVVGKSNASFRAKRIWAPILVVFTALLIRNLPSETMAWASLIAGVGTLIWLAVWNSDDDDTGNGITCAVLASVLASLWALHLAALYHVSGYELPIFAALLTALSVVVLAQAQLQQDSALRQSIADIYFTGFLVVLFAATTVVISRSWWAIGFEACCITGLAILVAAPSDQKRLSVWSTPLAAIAAAFWLQALLLRWLGPPGELTLLSIVKIQSPAIVSLLWAVLGAALTIWSRKLQARVTWIAGASLLVAATVKIVLLDFGSLGQLSNIIAVIAAGLVFIGVGWLAPMPTPAAPKPAAPKPAAPPLVRADPKTPLKNPVFADWPAPPAASAPASATAKRTTVNTHDSEPSQRGRAWAITIAIIALLSLARCSGDIAKAIRYIPHTEREQINHAAYATISAPEYVAQVPPTDIAARTEPEADNHAETTLALPDSSSTEEGTVATRPTIETACGRWASQLPANYDLVAAAAYQANSQGGSNATKNAAFQSYQVAVDHPGKPIVLLLGGLSPTNWMVRWTSATKIAGVWISGRDAQTISGLRSDIPLLLTDERSTPCPYFYFPDLTGRMDSAAQQILARTPQKVVASDAGGRITIGNAFGLFGPRTSTSQVESPFYQSPTSAGEKGLEELVRRGLLRHARNEDVARWRAFNGEPTLPESSAMQHEAFRI